MTNAYVLTGTLTDPQTVRLNEPLPVAGGEVRVTVEVVDPKPATGNAQRVLAVLEEIWAEQDARGYTPPTAEEVAEQIREAREGWGD